MKPVKTKLLKRGWTDEESEPQIPTKKRNKEKLEKENQNLNISNTHASSKVSKNEAKVLEVSSFPGNKINKIKRKKNKRSISSSSSSDDDDDSDDDFLDEMFIQLKKSGVKTTKSSSVDKLSKNNELTSSTKKKNLKSPLQNSSFEEKKCKRKLESEFGQFITSEVGAKENFVTEKKILELEKIPENFILNYTKTPVKAVKQSNEETPIKDNSNGTPLRRSSRRKLSVLSDEIIYEEEKTPVRRSCRTPSRKASSGKKNERPELRTPSSKNVENLPTTPLEKARLSLHVSTVPESLPCREKEYNDILTFLKNKLWDGIGGCMYISGVPGTGKTATVTQVIKYLQNQSKEGNVPEFKFIEINGMRLANPRQAYVHIWQKLFDKKEKIAADRAHRLLDNFFSKREDRNLKNTTVLLVDELDLICTKKQDVVYNLLDWPTRTHSRLVVLTIANTMDMPERLFKGRVTSRMGLTRLTFMPYTHKQLEEIVLARLNGLNAFVTDAVRLVTRKVAAVSGDARRALDICRRATELPPIDETVKICHIEQAIREMTNSNIVKIIRNCGELEKLFLRSLSDVSLRSNVEEVDLREVIDQLLTICTLEGVSRPAISTILSVTNRLKCCRLIFGSQANGGILQKLTLNVTQDDIHYALKT